MTGLRIHLVPAAALARYQHKRRSNLALLAPMARLDRWLPAQGIPQIVFHEQTEGWSAFHSWLPGLLALSDAEGGALRGLLDEVPASDPALTEQVLTRVREQGWASAAAVDLEQLTLRAILEFGALQNPWELRTFLGLVAQRPPRTVVEIGTSGGGLLFALAQLAAPDASLISIDTPEPFEDPALHASTSSVLPAMKRRGQTLHLIRERSTSWSVRQELEQLLGPRKLDLLVIDGDHSYGGVRSDFEMYAGLVAPGGTIALHDIAITPGNSGRGFDVGIYWAELAHQHRTESLIDPEGVAGVIAQRHLPVRQRKTTAFGWGLVFP